MISRFNGSELTLDLEDVDDYIKPVVVDTAGEAATPFLSSRDPSKDTSPPPSDPQLTNNGSPADYHSTGESANYLDAHLYSPPIENAVPKDIPSIAPVLSSASRSPHSPSGRRSRSSSASERPLYEKRVCSALPRWVRKPLWEWWDRVTMVLSPKWRRTTLLVWVAWWGMSLAYTMFNVFLPKLLETRSDSSDGDAAPKTLEESLWDIVYYTIGGLPGAILGAYMIESQLGRRWSLAGSTFVTALFCVLFVLVKSSWAVTATTVGISLSATTMWAVLYGWTPEIFGTKVRGTACGIASALSRVGGMIAPLLGGMLLVIDRSVPVYTGVVVFVIAGVAVLLLREDAGEGRRTRARVIVH